jgi:hypothetical protein
MHEIEQYALNNPWVIEKIRGGLKFSYNQMKIEIPLGGLQAEAKHCEWMEQNKKII